MRRPRRSALALFALLAACRSEPKATPASAEDRAAEPPTPAPLPEPVELPPTDEELIARAGVEVEAEVEAEAANTETGAAELDGGAEAEGVTEGEAEADPLAPELPSGPAPGSPEADAELAELLEDSTITQDEFDRAFKAGGPKVEGDQLVWDQRTRKRSKVRVQAPAVSEGGLTGKQLRTLAEADLRQLEGCHGMALRKDPDELGSARLKLSFDEAGAVSSASVDQVTGLGGPLQACLISVAEGWKLAAASGARATLKLDLAVE